MSQALDNYRQLLTRIDALCKGITDALDEQITCSEGCSSCCTAITLFPVEAAALCAALEALTDDEREAILQHVAEHVDGERCPLLSHHRCLLYDARPIICRTHGLPILYSEDDQRRLDCCPLNVIEGETLAGSAIIDLDKLNTLLVAVNSLYLSQTDTPAEPERLTIAESLLSKK